MNDGKKQHIRHRRPARTGNPASINVQKQFTSVSRLQKNLHNITFMVNIVSAPAKPKQTSGKN
jgi:hypothetical protein